MAAALGSDSFICTPCNDVLARVVSVYLLASMGITNQALVRLNEFLFEPHTHARTHAHTRRESHGTVGQARPFNVMHNSCLVSIRLGTLSSMRGLITVIIRVSRRRPGVI